MSFDSHHNPAQRIEDILEAIASIKESVSMDALEDNIRDMRAAFPWPIP